MIGSSLYPAMRRCMVGFCMVMSAATAQAEVDLLDLPSPPSSRATNSLLLDIERVGTDLFAVGEWGQVLTSNDNGLNWRAAKVPTSVLLTAISFKDEVTGFAVGHDGVVLRSDDAGATWNKILDGNAINKFILKAAKERVRELEARLISIPETDAVTREDIQVQLEDAEFVADTAQGDIDVGPFKPLLDVLAFRDGTVFVAGAYGQLLISRDNGFNWEYLGGKIQNPQGYHLNTVMRTSAGHVLVAGEQGRVFLTTDKGKTWENQSISYDGSIFHVIEQPKTGDLFAFGLRGNMFKLATGSNRWRAVKTGLNETLNRGLVLRDGSMLVVGARGILVHTNDGFQSLQIQRRADKQPSAGVIQLSDDTVLLAGMRGFKSLPVSVFGSNKPAEKATP